MSRSCDEEINLLLAPKEEHDYILGDGPATQEPLTRTLGHRMKQHSWLIHVLFACAYAACLIYWTSRSPPPCDPKKPLIYSPANRAVEYETKVVDGLATNSVFAGEPSPDLDLAWHNLLANINIRITGEEMQKLGQTSLEFQDGSGHLGTLGVYHELHCLKRVRNWIYRDHYYPNMTSHDHLEHRTHAEHCIELLRQAAICKGDVSVTAFKWLGNTLEPTTKEGVMHQCVNWERLSGWAAERVVDLFDPELLFKPDRPSAD